MNSSQSLVPNPFHVLQEHLLAPAIIQFRCPAVGVACNPLGGFKGPVVLQKIRDACRPKGVRRIVRVFRQQGHIHHDRLSRCGSNARRLHQRAKPSRGNVQGWNPKTSRLHLAQRRLHHIQRADDHPTFGTVALGINDIGEVVGDYVAANDPIPDPPKPPPRHGFLRSSKGVFTTFNVPGAVLTIGEGINNAGTIVGVYVLADGSEHGFVRTNGVFMTVDVPNSSNTAINSINANGQIVGSYDDSNGTHGFLGVPAN
jgi:probable HAF family extracellular repeat protein